MAKNSGRGSESSCLQFPSEQKRLPTSAPGTHFPFLHPAAFVPDNGNSAPAQAATSAAVTPLSHPAEPKAESVACVDLIDEWH
jgi:hypothetical protein